MATADAEELCESEVLWPEAPLGAGDHAAATTAPEHSCSSSSAVSARSGRGVPEKARRQGSRPVDIPRPARPARRCGDDEDGGGRSGTVVVPPHVLVSRRRPEGASFALRSGHGRARELSHLRDSVLHMTGFIEG